MASFNKVILMGNLVADPELKQTQSGISVCNFRIAVQRRFAKNDQNGQSGQQTADFFDIVVWRQSAEFVCRYFKKGSSILVCGQLQTRTWTDNQGQKRYATEIVADEVAFTSSASQSGNGASYASAAPAAQSGYAPDAYGAPAFNNAPSANFEEIPNDETRPF